MNKHLLAHNARTFISRLQKILDRQGYSSFSAALRTVNTTSVQRGPLAPCKHPTLIHMDNLSEQIADCSIRQAAQSLDWGQLYSGGGIDPSLANGMFAAQAAGTYGVFAADDVACGFFLLGPNVFYPLHTHQAQEVYHCLAGEIEIIHRLHEKPFTLSADQSSETPSGRLHALKTYSEPVLLAYCWIGEISAPTWWWTQDKDNNWFRIAWRREPGQSWKIDRREQVDDFNYNAALK